MLPGATVTVTNAGTQASRTVTTDTNGLFTVTDLLAGRYEVTVTLEGFKTYVQRDVVLSANERVALRPIALEVGTLNETIAVTAEAARVQTLSGERSGTITQDQIQDVSLKGKDYMGMLRHVPGVVDTQNREAPGWNNLGGISINGGRNNTVNLTYDGVTNLDTGSNTGPFLAPGLDSIAEIKVLTSNYQAEYGRSSGGTINVVTKSGGRDFHGGGFYSRRNEDYNANEWQNNKFGRPKPPYRFDYSGYHVGGPVLLPGDFNSGRNKLFFFWNQEFLPRTNPGNLERRTMPTELERRGDFSQSFDTNGRLIVIRDPQTGQAVPGQHHPDQPHRRERPGAAQPVPGAERHRPRPPVQLHVPERLRAAAQRPGAARRLERRARRRTFYSRLNFGYEAYKGGWGFVLNNANWPQLPIAYEIHSYGIVNTVLHTFNPTTVMEVTVGLNHGKQTVEPLTPADLERNDRTQVGLSGLPQFFPEANPDHIVPNANFGAAGLALANLPQLGVEGRYPFFGENDIWNSSVNLTKVAGSHNMKAGLFFEYTTRPAARSSQFNGTFNFNRDTNNPLDTNHPFANALIGSVQSYSEATGHPIANAQFANVEWFVQDNWRVAKNLTIDAGVRFYRIGPTKSQGDDLAVFLPDQYNAGGGPGADPAGEHAAGPARPQPDHRRDRPGGEDRHVRAEFRRPDQRHRGVPRERDGHAAHPGRAARGLLVGRQGRRQDGGARRLRRVPRPLQRRHRPAARRAAAAGQHADRQLHDHRRAARDAAEPEPGPGPHARSRLQAAVHLQLQHRRAARPRVEAGRRLLLRRLEGPEAAADAQPQRGAVRHELPAVEHRPDDRRRAAERVPPAVSRLRRHPVLGVRRLLELRRAADAGEPPLHGRPALRRRLHVRQDPERRHRLAAEQQPDGESVPRPSRIATTATPDGGTTSPSTTRTRCRT